VRIVIRLLCCVVIASAAITVWTRAALVFALGPSLASVCLWIAAGGGLCAVITLTGTRKPIRRQQQLRPPEPPARYIPGGDRGRVGSRHDRPASPPRGHSRARRATSGPQGPAGPALGDLHITLIRVLLGRG
jgi:hypothetical protein